MPFLLSSQASPSTDACGPERLPVQMRPSALGVELMSPISHEASPVVDCQVSPKSSVTAMPSRSPPTNKRFGSTGSKVIEVIRPPTPGSVILVKLDPSSASSFGGSGAPVVRPGWGSSSSTGLASVLGTVLAPSSVVTPGSSGAALLELLLLHALARRASARKMAATLLVEAGPVMIRRG